MENEITQILREYPKKTIELSVIENQCLHLFSSYGEFATCMLLFENQGLIEAVKSKGRKFGSPSLAYCYRIKQKKMSVSYHEEIEALRLQLDERIDMDVYYRVGSMIFFEDKKYLEKISTYMQLYKDGQPIAAPAPERSSDMVGNEKWLDDEGGRELLKRIGLLEWINIYPVADPLMFAVNPNRFHEKNHAHIILENKTTYHALAHIIEQLPFTTVIYGVGNKIVKSLAQFEQQFPIAGKHDFYYFGDFDRAGINILYSLSKRYEVKIAYPFYYACLAFPPRFGKENQSSHEGSLAYFYSLFPEDVANNLKGLLERGAYYPQEVLTTKSIQRIGKEFQWNNQ
ncbi:MAG: Wadjet anti-phage system protein JetD domain-containing protein [Bacilli bacterium]